MLFSFPKSIEDIIIESIKNGPIRTTDLINRIKKIKQKTTKQGVYRVLRLLAKEEIIVIHKKMISLNIRWLNKINNFSTLAQYYYVKDKSVVGNFLNLQEEEKIKYTFNSLALTDAFWNHAIYLLLQIIPAQENWLAYNPHAWFFLARPDEEKAIMKAINKDRQYLLTVGHQTIMDKIICKEFDGTRSQYYTLNKVKFKNNYYLNVLGDFIIEVYLDQDITQAIENWYNKTKEINDQNISELKKIIQTKKKNKLVITRNSYKARKLKQQFQKNFYINRCDSRKGVTKKAQ